VRKYINRLLITAAGVFYLIFGFTSCNESNDLGLELLPGEDLINVNNVVIKNGISAFTESENGIVTSNTTYNLLGSINDPVFGNTTISMAAQLRLTSFPDFGTNPVIDSTFLVLFYRVIYGDTLTTQHLKIYELEQGLDADAEYKQDVDLKSMASTTMLGEISFVPKVELDTLYQDTVYQFVKIPMDNSLSERIANADSTELISNDMFLNLVKGLYIETERVSSPSSGTLLTFETVPASTTGFTGSALYVYYNNDENKAAAQPDTLARRFSITEYSARVNSIYHDYSGTPFESTVNQDTEETANIFVQPTGGLKTKIVIEDLSHWKDTTNAAINKAELVFQVDTIASQKDIYPLPGRLLLTYVNPKGEEELPDDYFYNSSYYDGYLRDDYTYHFNITQHVQQMINITDPEDDKYVGNAGFYLTTGRRPDIGNRAVLEGTNADAGIKLIVTYSKYLQ
jgi:hypothetical protein